MARSSILGGERVPTQSAGRDADALGPSDSSDSGSDIQNEPSLEPSGNRDRLGAGRSKHADSDAEGTGERGSALTDEGVEEGSDISPDHIEVIGPDLTGDADDASVREIRARTQSIETDEEDEAGDAQDVEGS